MPAKSKEFRMERIEKLLNELKYEVVRGLMENELDERISFTHIHGLSREIPDGMVEISFNVRPINRWELNPGVVGEVGKLRVVK